ncbi:GAF domain-containing protein [Aspergillus candidus]|uniref:GAF domain-like protein n=1 Tax=Aspergillus candidus TaxID=41067 RepID=A0A2I2FPR8_ASPCN|nr:GAF domain-like protein [Aspergillus candidus]PLB42615.1 GAF domain-like protein [Aspergillus candidus]
MPHADASYFGDASASDFGTANASKSEVYAQVLDQARGLVTGQRNWISNFSNVASLLWHAYAALPAPSSAVNWAGFYIRQDKFPKLGSSGDDQTANTTPAKPTLLLGPFQGRPACQEIRFGRGVCGSAAEKRETLVVPDVMSFPGHIACDASSRSEIVVPILSGGETVAIIDIDCTEPDGFDDVDRKYLEELAGLLAECCDW